MRFGRLKKDKSWNYGIAFENNWFGLSPLAKIFAVWFFKLKEIPEDEGSYISDLNYVGFWYKKYLMTRWNVIVYTKTFRIPYWIKIKKD